MSGKLFFKASTLLAPETTKMVEILVLSEEYNQYFLYYFFIFILHIFNHEFSSSRKKTFSLEREILGLVENWNQNVKACLIYLPMLSGKSLDDNSGLS